jgi:2-hydroxy-3-keto-5-methylthiopentenyl-1-phosphate phosphatase
MKARRYFATLTVDVHTASTAFDIAFAHAPWALVVESESTCGLDKSATVPHLERLREEMAAGPAL